MRSSSGIMAFDRHREQQWKSRKFVHRHDCIDVFIARDESAGSTKGSRIGTNQGVPQAPSRMPCGPSRGEVRATLAEIRSTFVTREVDCLSPVQMD